MSIKKGESNVNKDYFDSGIKVLKEILKDDADKFIIKMNSLHEGIAEDIVEGIYGRFYSREGLDLKIRELVTIALFLSHGTNEQLAFHIQAGLNIGVTKKEIAEVILHSSTVIGWPKALNGLQVLKNITDITVDR